MASKSNKRVIKHRLFTWFEESDSPIGPGHEPVFTERIAHFGDDVELNDAAIKRGEELDAFFSDKDAKAIREGTYTGQHAALLDQFAGRAAKPQSIIQPADGEGPQTADMSSEELGEYINENKLTVDETVALATDGDTDSIEKVYDAEEHAARLRDNEPRAGVTDKLDKMLQAAAQSK
jgi:hypothetical protein